MTPSMSLDIQMIWIAFHGSRNKKQKEKTEMDIPQWNKKGKILAVLFFFKEAACSFHEPCSLLKSPGGIGYGLQRWTNRGYKHTSRMWYLSRIQVKNRSKPRP